MTRAARHLFITTDAVGGVWQYTADLVAALKPLGYRTTIAVLGPSPTAEQRRAVTDVGDVRIIETGLPLDWTAKTPAEVVASASAIAELSTGIAPDVVQLHAPALAVSGRFEAPVVAVAHSCVGTWWRAVNDGPLPLDLEWRAKMTAEGIATADRVVAPSVSFADALSGCYRLSRRPLVVYNGRSTSCAPAGMHDFAFTAGRLWDKAKNARVLDAVAAGLAIPFKAAGSVRGPHGEAVKLSNLHLMGQVEEEVLLSCLAARPVFVSAARYEPFGLAVLEAANAGCALVLSDIPTFRELWDGVATFVAPDDVAGFTSAIGELVGDVSLRLESGKRAMLHARRYSPARMARDMAAIHDGLARSAAPLRRTAAA
ncbi:glycosyl transferase family 1 [Tardibacter chloracetimidivorans]|uniref:Glycosyl transferase family 1 n=1 Tax=Tardibacter chloracetimidivorans TaxID=1921510 RepID=A0A1L3ZTG8_9SPHN|nr:glycosyltransferase family 4 protein [Tardibacter chloracetimidivorans]API58936.1 glycosyl transferase family 1 [Tardibacter chloracetimidivorans]